MVEKLFKMSQGIPLSNHKQKVLSRLLNVWMSVCFFFKCCVFWIVLFLKMFLGCFVKCRRKLYQSQLILLVGSYTFLANTQFSTMHTVTEQIYENENIYSCKVCFPTRVHECCSAFWFIHLLIGHLSNAEASFSKDFPFTHRALFFPDLQISLLILKCFCIYSSKNRIFQTTFAPCCCGSLLCFLICNFFADTLTCPSRTASQILTKQKKWL